MSEDVKEPGLSAGDAAEPTEVSAWAKLGREERLGALMRALERFEMSEETRAGLMKSAGLSNAVETAQSAVSDALEPVSTNASELVAGDAFRARQQADLADVLRRTPLVQLPSADQVEKLTATTEAGNRSLTEILNVQRAAAAEAVGVKRVSVVALVIAIVSILATIAFDLLSLSVSLG